MNRLRSHSNILSGLLLAGYLTLGAPAPLLWKRYHGLNSELN
jgi:hypothetical protein